MTKPIRTTTRKPTTHIRSRRLHLQTLEDRTMPSFGFATAFGFGGPGGAVTNATARDAAGNLYVAGYFNNTADFDPSHAGPASVLTASGSGSDGFVAKYSASGTYQWVDDLGPIMARRVVVQGAGIYAVDGGAIFRLDPTDGHVVWTTASRFTAFDVAAGPSGTVYACGWNSSAGIVTRLDPATGNAVWTQTGGGDPRYLAVDGSGNIDAAGWFSGIIAFNNVSSLHGGTMGLVANTGANDTFVWKLSATGTTIWAGAMGGGSNGGITQASGIAADASGNVYVVGNYADYNATFVWGQGNPITLTNHTPHYDDFLVKLVPAKDGSMTATWATDFGSNGTDNWVLSFAVAVDGSGNVYTGGNFSGTINFNPKSGPAHNLSAGSAVGSYLSELDKNGNYVAAASVVNATVYGLSLDSNRNVYLAGYFSGTTNFNPNGSPADNLTSYGSNAFVAEWTQTSPQLAISRGPNVGVVPLTQSQLNAAEAAAIREWAAAGLPAIDVAKMKSVTADVTTLGGDNLGAAELNGTTIAIDATADGWGWAVNPNSIPAAGQMDLLTVVEHELGHTIGLDSRFSGNPNDLMYAFLSPGERRLPGSAEVPNAKLAANLLSEVARMSGEGPVDWLSAVAALKPKMTSYATWLA